MTGSVFFYRKTPLLSLYVLTDARGGAIIWEGKKVGGFMSYGLQFLVICVLVVLGCGKITLQGRVSRAHVRNASDSVLFNAKSDKLVSGTNRLKLVAPIGVDGKAS